MIFHKTLRRWYLHNSRNLPWRQTTHPYPIWLSEIIMQQTRIDQGTPYYKSFLKSYPDVFSLAAASEEEVLKLWQGLGYYSRARNLHQTAQFVARELGGVFPSNYKGLLGLKGVGDYTASAIASFCYGEPVAVVDGNVYRVLSRIFGIDTPINTTLGSRQFKELAQELLDRKDPATFNQGLMEFGALQCKPQSPNCSECPFSKSCVAFNQNRIQELPVKLKKQKVRDRHFNYLVFVSGEKKTLFQQRRGKGIWQGLYEFPLVETLSEAGAEHLVQEEAFRNYSSARPSDLELFNVSPVVHKLSHQHIYAKFWILACEELPEEGVSLESLGHFPVPVLIHNFIEAINF